MLGRKTPEKAVEPEKPKRVTGACKDCAFFDYEGITRDDGVGLCRRFPPDLHSRTWPHTTLLAWCGEFRKGPNDYEE